MKTEKLNILVKTLVDDKVVYTLTNTQGKKFVCKTWVENKKDREPAEHVILPEESGVGRKYVRTSHFDKSDIYTFETKTEFRTGLSSGGWKSRLTDEEKVELEGLETRIEELKKVALERPVVKIDPNSPEGLKRRIEQLQKMLEKAKG